MEKLLHERLREWADKDKANIPILHEWMHYFGGSIDKPPKDSEIWEALADEIERYYIPCPRIDGEPVKDGDVVCQIYDEKPDKVSGIGLVGGEISVLLDDHGWFNESEIKRPTPKVLDANGVEIKVGDTVYGIEDGISQTVTAFSQSEITGTPTVHVIYDATGHSDVRDGKYLTHERPVFDANGERIRKGDVVWDLDTLEKLHVEEFANRECGLVQCSNEEDGDCEDHDANRLIHREPDSYKKVTDYLESIVEDMEDRHFDKEWTDEIKEAHNRLTALIERGA